MGKILGRFAGWALVFFFALTATAQLPTAAPGTRAPDFHARDQFGREQDRASLTGPNGLVLLFFRSADW